MAYLIVMVKVKDYSKWKPEFDEFADTRKEYGSKGGRLFRNVDKLNEPVILYEWESIEKAKKFTQSEDIRKTMERAGVIGIPEFYFLEEVERVSG